MKSYETIYKNYEKLLGSETKPYSMVGWPNEKDLIKRYNIMFDSFSNFLTENKEITLLDFGCGIAGFLKYLKSLNSSENINYIGMDVSKKFIDYSKELYPKEKFLVADLIANPELMPRVDVTIINGVFTQKFNLDNHSMLNFLKKIVKIIFNKTKYCIALNVMSNCVDYKKKGAFHLKYDDFSKFITDELSKKYIFRNDYLPYEYTTYIYKDYE
tara:strand:+ start:31 stop:672 length:642 start_codon:yes stop_codon:yes gene_type:complete